jgi:cysteinyl-tRNA synthetase
MEIYNSLGRVKQPFKSRVPRRIKLFSCGPSVYQSPHIGNYRTFCYEDMVCRYLTYLGYTVEHCVNFTDIEDKAVHEAVKNNQDVYAQTEPAEARYVNEMMLLNCQQPTYLPKASTSITEAIELIEILISKKLAYVLSGNVYFQTQKVPTFGKVFGLDLSKWPKKNRRFSLDTYPGNYWNKGDFILWHKADDKSLKVNAAWNSPWGIGRPSWNIQDPAMIKQTLGLQVDINCGGIDNIVRHHDYNVAIIEGASGKTYANYYMHGSHLMVNSKKMSKSKGTIIYPQHLIDQGFSGNDIRFFLLAVTHYRKQLNFTTEAFAKQAVRRQNIRQRLQFLLTHATATTPSDLANQLITDFETAMNDDFSMALAVNAIEKLLNETATIHPSEVTTVQISWNKINEVLQLF